jgi:hypothetical protein
MTRLFFNGLLGLVCVVVVTITSGCGQSGPERVEVSGTVAYQGQPVKEGMIRFIPTKGTEGPAWGARIVDGKYSARGKGGVPVGTHKVEIIAHRDKPKPARSTSPPPSGFELDAPVPREQYLPEKYNTKTELEITIPPGSGKIVENYDLTE